MPHDTDRLSRNQREIAAAPLDALVATLPTDVLLLSGYWPVVGTSIAIATPEKTVVLAPEDEAALARKGFADEVRTFAAGSLDRISNAADAVAPLLHETLHSLGLAQGRIGYRSASSFEPSSYASMHLYGGSLLKLVAQAAPDATLTPADGLIARLRSTLSAVELESLRLACHIAEHAFAAAAEELDEDLTESEAAGLIRAALHEWQPTDAITRAGGFAWCMSGPNSAAAYKAYQQSGPRQIRSGELILMHCNSYVNGYWTDITRTYVLGVADQRQTQLYSAVLEARAAATAAVKPGVRAADVDAAARAVMTAHGLGDAFKHPTGHSVGYSAINHDAPPRLHPKSQDVLEPGMVFNIEPAAYFEGYGGLRHCDMVLVTPQGCEVLTPFHADAELLQL